MVRSDHENDVIHSLIKNRDQNIYNQHINLTFKYSHEQSSTTMSGNSDDFVESLKVPGYTFKGSNSAIFFLPACAMGANS